MSDTPFSGEAEASKKARQINAAMARLQSLHPKLIDLSLDRMHQLLAKLGHPEKQLPPVIHVAGTNGKGSTIATMRAIAEAAGYRVHVYTSPHLVRFNERIRLAGQLIDDAALAALIDEVEAVNGGAPITFFEVTTAIAFLAFSRTGADLLLLEVGLGGRLDATNVVEDPAASVITPISHDHEEFLGTDLADIAGEKAGIIKPGSPVIAAPQRGKALKIIQRHADEKGCPIVAFGSGWRYRSVGSEIVFSDQQGDINLPFPHLPGPHQLINACAAVAAMRAQEAVSISDAAIRAGMGWVRWPGRLQWLTDSPLAAPLPPGAELWLDGGHNAAAAAELRGFLRRFDPVDQPITLICGMMRSKDARAFLSPFRGLVERLIAVPIPGQDGAIQPAELAATASDLEIQGQMARDVSAAIGMVAKACRKDAPPIILIAGSLYLAGHTLAGLGIIPD